MQPLLHQQAVIAIERDHIGHRSQCDQVQQYSEVRFGKSLSGKPAPRTQSCPQRQHDIKCHADAGEVPAGKFHTAAKTGIDDRVRRWQLCAGQMVVRDQHPDAAFPGGCNTRQAGDTVIHGDEEIRMPGRGNGDNLGGQSVTVFEAVGNEIIHVCRTHAAQGAQAQRAAGRAIDVKVADYEYPPVCLDSLCQQLDGRFQAAQSIRWQQPFQRVIEITRGLDGTRGIHPLQNRRQIRRQPPRIRDQRASEDASRHARSDSLTTDRASRNAANVAG